MYHSIQTHIKSPFMKSLPSILVFLFAAMPTVSAWGHEGHEIVANIAYNLLTPETKAASYHVLFPSDDFNTTDYTSPLAAVANWADKVRFTKYFSWTTPLHYVDVRDDLISGGCPSIQEASGESSTKSDCAFVYQRDCAGGACAVGAIVKFSDLSRTNKMTHKRLRAPQNPYLMHNVTTQRQSLMFLIHIIGDIHQPLHVSRESDRGGNTIHVSFADEFPGFRDERLGHAQKEWNLHSVWDSGIIERAIRLYHNSSQYSFRSYIENSLLTQDNIELWSACPLNVGGVGSKACTSEWAQESFRDALMYAYGDENGKEVKDGAHLSEEYFETRLEVVQLRLAAGGVRLAATLEDIFGIRGEESQVA